MGYIDEGTALVWGEENRLRAFEHRKNCYTYIVHAYNKKYFMSRAKQFEKIVLKKYILSSSCIYFHPWSSHSALHIFHTISVLVVVLVLLNFYFCYSIFVLFRICSSAGVFALLFIFNCCARKQTQSNCCCYRYKLKLVFYSPLFSETSGLK